MFTQPAQIPRSPRASTITLAVHAALGALVWALAVAAPELPAARERLTFVLVSAPRNPVDLPPLPKIKPEPMPRPEPPKVIETLAPPPPPPPVETRRVAEPTPPSAPRPAPAPPAPKVVVGAFAERAESTTPRQPSRTVESSGFENRTSNAAQARAEVREVGSFDATMSDGALRARAARTVADVMFTAEGATASRRHVAGVSEETGFGSAPPESRRAAPGALQASGFASDTSVSAARPGSQQAVASSGFAETVAPPTAVRAANTQEINRAVEVTYKPRPEYTDEARRLRIEGEVLLEVEFTADGQVRVLHVTRGLGHGLDEMAARAVQQMRFNPALRNGVPVTSRTRVNIVFRLT